MKYVLLAMGIMSFILIGGAGTISIILTKILGGGIEESFIYPIYGGLIVLSGMVAVVCEILLVEIRDLKKEIEKLKEEKSKNEVGNPTPFLLFSCIIAIS